ncbi:type II toxin-antitoxin system VapB family antitoxin [Streptomyces cyaneofuscatus]|uniref:type II toxin-antitoxin system VapB family antitoxin n=1 Tax=Streptomyces cyaneofuscatus TaxID=66883 RepID=UPI0036ABD050
MIRTVIDLGDEALEAAADEPGAAPRRTAINTALRESVDRTRRLCALRELQDLASSGALDMDLLLDKRTYRGGSARET